MIEGPVEYIVISFSGNQFRGEIIPALREIVEQGIVRIIDLLFMRKDEDGNVAIIELDDMHTPFSEAIDTIVGAITGIIAEEEVEIFAQEIENDSSAAIILLEHLWAARLSEAVLRANGKLVADVHVPKQAVVELIEKYGNPSE